jgi:cobalt-zinc-cadmium efflux system outer membrane protein
LLALIASVGPALAEEPAEVVATTRVADAREVSLDEVLRYAERSAPAVLVASARRSYGSSARESARRPRYNPNLELGAGPRFAEANRRDYDLRARLEQPVEIGGQRGRRIEVAERAEDRLEQELRAVRWALRRQVMLAYSAGVVARERVRLTESLVGFSDELLTIARRRQTAGDLGVIDVQLAEADAAQARQERALAHQDLRTAQLTLCEVTGWPVESPPLPRAGLEAPRPLPALTAVLSTPGERHPELRSRRAAVAEAHARAQLEAREGWPTPTFGLELAREGALYEPESYVVLGTVGLELPLWQRNQQERTRAQTDESVARAEENAALLERRARVARAHSDLRAATERLQLFTSTVAPSLENSLKLLQRAFDAGEIPLFSVALARERFLETQHAALDAYAEYVRARAELEYALGTRPLSR